LAADPASITAISAIGTHFTFLGSAGSISGLASVCFQGLYAQSNAIANSVVLANPAVRL
jgi:hypothetical protein